MKLIIYINIIPLIHFFENSKFYILNTTFQTFNILLLFFLKLKKGAANATPFFLDISCMQTYHFEVYINQNSLYLKIYRELYVTCSSYVSVPFNTIIFFISLGDTTFTSYLLSFFCHEISIFPNGVGTLPFAYSRL